MVSSAALCEQAGITYRQLDHWIRLGLVGDPARLIVGTGHPREFSIAETTHVITVAKLVRAGLSLRAAFDWTQRLVWDVVGDTPVGTGSLDGVTLSIRA